MAREFTPRTFSFNVAGGRCEACVELGYVRLGQPAPQLSGGEAQRVKFSRELAKPGTGQTLYILDEPTTGLHFADIEKLLHVLERLVEAGNTVLVVEHNLEVIQAADWVIDMGPEAGAAGGKIVVEGPPEDLVIHAERWRKAASGKPAPEEFLRSHTGEALAAFAAVSLSPSWQMDAPSFHVAGPRGRRNLRRTAR